MHNTMLLPMATDTTTTIGIPRAIQKVQIKAHVREKEENGTLITMAWVLEVMWDIVMGMDTVEPA